MPDRLAVYCNAMAMCDDNDDDALSLGYMWYIWYIWVYVYM